MQTNKITPWGETIVNEQSNICQIFDHMVAPKFINLLTIDIKKFYGHNTIDKILKDFMPHVDTLIFHDYHCIVGNNNYKKFYVESFFNKTVKDYFNVDKDNSIDFSLKEKKFNYLSNKPRAARLLASSWIAENYNNFNEFNYTQAYEDTAEHVGLAGEFMISASLPEKLKILPKKWITVNSSVEQINKNAGGMVYDQNHFNFYNGIRDEIIPTVFSIVMEPVFWEHGCMLTEKYVNAILGGTIPIVNGYEIYEVIEQMGFDTFSDIIDVSAQYEKNPIYRILNLLEKNKNCLDNAIEIINDSTVQKRILNNIKILESYDYNLAKKRYTANELDFLKQFIA